MGTWLEYDGIAFALLVFGITAIEILVLTRACIQLGGFARERNRIKHGTPFYDQEPGVILGIPKSVVE
jgi:hypothetical protein